MQEAKSLLEQINMARVQPQYFIQDLNMQLSHFESENCMKTLKGERLQVIQGAHIWKNATTFLESLTPKRSLTWCEELCIVACEYESKLARGENVSAFQLLKQHYDYNGNISFNTCQSQAEQTPREMVMSMIVDDGDERRGNRKTLFDASYKYFGAFVTKRDNVNIIVMFFSDTNNFRIRVPGQVKISRSRFENLNETKKVTFGQKVPFGSLSMNQHFYDRVPRICMKKTNRSSIVVRDGKTMKIKTTKTQYDDGSVSQNQTEELIL